MSVSMKRVYEAAADDDGYRVLIDGLWPRGINKEKLRVEKWLKPIAPSAALRRWYGHQPERWEEFRRRYREELKASAQQDLLDDLVRRARKGKVTLVIAARDAEHSNGAVLAEWMSERLHKG